MIPVLRRFFHDLFFSAERATLWMRGVIGWIAGAGAQMLATDVEKIQAWSVKDWLLHFLVAGAAGLALMFKAGDKNRTDAEVRAVVDDRQVALPLSPPLAPPPPNPPPMS